MVFELFPALPCKCEGNRPFSREKEENGQQQITTKTRAVQYFHRTEVTSV